MDEACGRVVIISARVGAGHNCATEELARRLAERGYAVDSHDFMELLPGRSGGGSLRTYGLLLRRAPWVYGALFGIGNHPLTTIVTRTLLARSRRHVLRLMRPDVQAVVSTYSLASQVLGSLRRRGELHVPAVTYVTDFAVHRHWVAPGVDAHLAAHAVGAEQARTLGGRGALAAGALVAPAFRPTADANRARARDHFGLPAGRLALVAAGSWGVGRVEATAADVAASGVAVPIVVCGRNSDLHRRLLRRGVHALDWVDDMPWLMQGVDVLIENAGGLMALEGMACGLPVATYRPIPGHGRHSAAGLARAGVSAWIRDADDVGRTLADLMEGPRGRRQRLAAQPMFDDDAATIIAGIAKAGAPR